MKRVSQLRKKLLSQVVVIFFLHGMSCIAHEREVLARLFNTRDETAIYSIFDSNVEFDDVYVRANLSAELRLLLEFKKLRSAPRIFALVDNAHVPTLKLLRAMGVVFIVSLRDSLSNIGKLLQDSSRVRYMSPDLQSVIKAIQAAPVWAAEWDVFDGAQYLTPAETEIILELLQGVPPWQIAKRRLVSVKTVSTHKLNALRKMELRELNEFFITSRR